MKNRLIPILWFNLVIFCVLAAFFAFQYLDAVMSARVWVTELDRAGVFDFQKLEAYDAKFADVENSLRHRGLLPELIAGRAWRAIIAVAIAGLAVVIVNVIWLILLVRKEMRRGRR